MYTFTSKYAVCEAIIIHDICLALGSRQRPVTCLTPLEVAFLPLTDPGPRCVCVCVNSGLYSTVENIIMYSGEGAC